MPRQSGNDRLPPTRVSREEMRFDRVQQNETVGIPDGAIDLHVSTGRIDRNQSVPIIAVVNEQALFDSVQVRTEDCRQFAFRRRPVQPGGHNHAPVSATLQGGKHEPEHCLRRSRPRGIVDDDERRIRPRQEFVKHRSSERLRKSVAQNSMVGTPVPLSPPHDTDGTALRHRHRDPLWAVTNCDWGRCCRQRGSPS